LSADYPNFKPGPGNLSLEELGDAIMRPTAKEAPARYKTGVGSSPFTALSSSKKRPTMKDPFGGAAGEHEVSGSSNIRAGENNESSEDLEQ
jgi:hypothetical protein